MIENTGRTKHELANRIVICIAIVLAILFFIPKKAKADIASGTWGTCPWTIDDAGTLTIGAGTGTGTDYFTDTSTGKVADSWQTDNKPHDVKLSFGKTYTLSETSVPNGYEKAQNITITVSADGSLTVDGKKISDTNVSMIDTRKPYILPSTGGSGNRRAALLLLSLSSLFALLFLSTKKREDKDTSEGD